MADDSTASSDPGGSSNQTDSDLGSLAIKALQDLVVAVNNLAQTFANAPT